MKMFANLAWIAVLLSIRLGLPADSSQDEVLQMRQERGATCAASVNVRAMDEKESSTKRIIQGRVVKDTTFFGRKLRVTPVGSDQCLPDLFEVEVPRRAEVVKHGRKISVHEIRTGDAIRAAGSWRNPGFVAVKIQVNYGHAWSDYDRGRVYRIFRGRIASIDPLGRRFALDTEAGERQVYAERARVWRADDLCGFDDLRRGAEVRVRGNADGNLIDAERIEIVRAEHASRE